MSTDRNYAEQQSAQLSSSNIKLFVVGIGHFVDHGELHSLAHDFKYVFSSTDSDVINKLLIETAHSDCSGKCYTFFTFKSEYTITEDTNI